MGANPFKKERFSSYRGWEEALVLFLADQFRNPNIQAWLSVVEDDETRENAAFLSLHLANIAYTRQADQEEALRKVFPALMNASPCLPDFKQWLSKRWFDCGRLTDAVKYAIQHNIAAETHRLVA